MTEVDALLLIAARLTGIGVVLAFIGFQLATFALWRIFK